MQNNFSYNEFSAAFIETCCTGMQGWGIFDLHARIDTNETAAVQKDLMAVGYYCCLLLNAAC